jgi:hypothetical protein
MQIYEPLLRYCLLLALLEDKTSEISMNKAGMNNRRGEEAKDKNLKTFVPS